MKIENIPIDLPILPEIELDGGYAICSRCSAEITPMNDRCPYCNQKQDWTWLKNND